MSNNIVINEYEKYRFFFIETTSDCNLNCRYCYYRKSKRNPEHTSNEIVDVLSEYDKLIICFIGGEPFLNHDFMEQIIGHKKLKHKDVIFSTNTNGTLFRYIKPECLSRFTFHHLSIDGAKKSNDWFRGDGVYQKIQENIKYLRKHSDAGIIARMTISDPQQLLDIPDLVGCFDAVYWQINNTLLSLPHDFINTYKKCLEDIFTYWATTHSKLKHFTFIPFIGMADLILTGGMSNPDLICGAGTSHLNICVDSTIYPCPESPHRLGTKERLGDISHFSFRTYESKSRCELCDIFIYCGGRCAMTDDDLYCETTRHLYMLLKEFLSVLDDEQLQTLRNLIEFQKPLAYTTEVIP